MYQTIATWDTGPDTEEINDILDPKVAEMQAAGLTDGVLTTVWPGGEEGVLPVGFQRTWTTEAAAQEFKTFVETSIVTSPPISVVVSAV
jgi:hypothetical protein